MSLEQSCSTGADLIELIGKTPGFEIKKIRDGSFTIIRKATTDVGEASIKIAPKAEFVQYKNAVTRLRRIGWTFELHEELNEIKDISRKERWTSAQIVERIDRRLRLAFTGSEEPKAPAAERERRADVKRHGKAQTHTETTPEPEPLVATAKIITTEIFNRPEQIGPERAFELLCRMASYQRKTSKTTVADYVGRMQRGEWRLAAHSPICIDVNGNPNNGAHRLTAVFESGLAQDFMVMYNVPVEEFEVMDTGRLRTGVDMMYSEADTDEKKRQSSNITPMLNILHLWYNVPREEWATARTPSHLQRRNVLAEHNEELIRHSVTHGRLAFKRLSAAVTRACHYLIAEHALGGDPALVDSWYKSIAKVAMGEGEPCHTLGLYFLRASNTRVSRNAVTEAEQRKVVMHAILTAWNKTATGDLYYQISRKTDYQVPHPLKPDDKRMYYPGSRPV